MNDDKNTKGRFEALSHSDLNALVAELVMRVAHLEQQIETLLRRTENYSARGRWDDYGEKS
jgi:uncharacterized protein YceH (UPF0502 family)